LPSAPDKKTITNISSPILACNVFTLIAASAGSLRLFNPKNTGSAFEQLPAQVVIWFG
jgi:hypothetical protein